MIQAGDGSGLTLETLFEIGIIGKMRRQDFDGYCAVEAGVFGFVDFAHATGTDLPRNLIRAELGAGLKCHVSLGERGVSVLRPSFGPGSTRWTPALIHRHLLSQIGGHPA